jgi:hypothetical protein
MRDATLEAASKIARDSWLCSLKSLVVKAHLTNTANHLLIMAQEKFLVFEEGKSKLLINAAPHCPNSSARLSVVTSTAS